MLHQWLLLQPLQHRAAIGEAGIGWHEYLHHAQRRGPADQAAIDLTQQVTDLQPLRLIDKAQLHAIATVEHLLRRPAALQLPIIHRRNRAQQNAQLQAQHQQRGDRQTRLPPVTAHG